MNGIFNRLVLLASLIIPACVGGLAATSAQQVAPTLSALTGKGSSPLELRRPRPLSQAEERALSRFDRFRECERCPVMIVIPGGSFIMGASAAEQGSTPDERPQHQVTLRGFAIGRFPVSRDEWDGCVAAKGCSSRTAGAADGRGSEPVAGIQWDEARDYVAWLARVTGRPYRLLSEAEREYAARAGTTTAFWWGDPPGDDAVKLDGPDVVPATFDVIPSDPNPWGIYQVHGAVYDWVEDCWHDSYAGAPADGSAWTEDGCDRHVLRGGSFNRTAQTRRAAARMWFGSQNRMPYMSVRVARSLQQ
jgi:formylglycine-generating enzyme required for sulfatase activity